MAVDRREPGDGPGLDGNVMDRDRGQVLHDVERSPSLSSRARDSSPRTCYIGALYSLFRRSSIFSHRYNDCPAASSVSLWE